MTSLNRKEAKMGKRRWQTLGAIVNSRNNVSSSTGLKNLQLKLLKTYKPKNNEGKSEDSAAHRVGRDKTITRTESTVRN